MWLETVDLTLVNLNSIGSIEVRKDGVVAVPLPASPSSLGDGACDENSHTIIDVSYVMGNNLFNYTESNNDDFWVCMFKAIISLFPSRPHFIKQDDIFASFCRLYPNYTGKNKQPASMKLTCPYDVKHTLFRVETQVVEEWEVDSAGIFIRRVSPLRVDHRPGIGDKFACAVCGHGAINLEKGAKS